jgi:hypothetical protein
LVSLALVGGAVSTLSPTAAAATPPAATPSVPAPQVAVGDASGRITTHAEGDKGNVAPRSAIDTLANTATPPNALAFDGPGDLWATICHSASGVRTESIVEFSRAQVTAGGAPTPTVSIAVPALNGAESCPIALAFDGTGDLWVAMASSRLLVEYPKAQLSSVSPQPSVAFVLSNSPGDNPVGLTFGEDDTAWVTMSGDGAANAPRVIGLGLLTLLKPDVAADGCAGTPLICAAAPQLPATTLNGTPHLGSVSFGPDLWMVNTDAGSVAALPAATLKSGGARRATRTFTPPTYGTGLGQIAVELTGSVCFGTQTSLWVTAPSSGAVVRYVQGAKGAWSLASSLVGTKTQLGTPTTIAEWDRYPVGQIVTDSNGNPVAFPMRASCPLALSPRMVPSLKAKAGKKQIVLTWTKVKAVSGWKIDYVVEISANKKTWRKLTTAKKTTYTAKKLKKGKKYYFRIETYALNGKLRSTTISKTISAKPK